MTRKRRKYWLGNAKVCCQTLQIPEPKALNLQKDHLAEHWNVASFRICPLQLFMPKSPESEKNGEIFRRFSSFNSRESGHKKFHEKLATNSAGREIKFFHSETGSLGADVFC